MRAINIEWDVTDGAKDMTQKEINEILETLPTAIDIPDEIKNSDDDDAISDYISNTTGFCHYGFELYDGKGYEITDFDGTGMLEIEKYDAADMFETDEDAVKQAIKDGIKLIPIDELPKNFERRYLGWIDTPENRKAIEDYCKQKA